MQPTFSACGDLSGNWENEPSKRPDAQSIAETCSNARDAVHRFFTIAIPAWLTARHAAALKWIADGRAQKDMNGAFKTAHSSVLVFPFASAVVGAKGPSELFIMLNQAVYHFVNLYLLFLFIRCASPFCSTPPCALHLAHQASRSHEATA